MSNKKKQRSARVVRVPMRFNDHVVSSLSQKRNETVSGDVTNENRAQSIGKESEYVHKQVEKSGKEKDTNSEEMNTTDAQNSFPDEVLDLGKSVRTLDLTHNKLVDVPEEISKLLNMQRLILANNMIGRLPMNIGKLQSLKLIMLDGNQLTTLPDEVGQLVRLERLSISGNLLTSLPETIGSLRNLLLLNVSLNKLKSLPESVGSCFSLEELQANENSIEELPTSVCSLIHLKSLCLDHNNLKQIPPSLLKECKTLQNISLHGNPISMDQFQQMEGFKEFEDRRKKKFDKQIDSNVMISSKGLDEGVDL